MLSEKRGEEAGQEDGEKPRENVASGKTNAPTISPTEARGLALRVSGGRYQVGPGEEGLPFSLDTTWAGNPQHSPH